jgi:hypothetical protein
MLDEHPLSKFCCKRLFATKDRSHFDVLFIEEIYAEGFSADVTSIEVGSAVLYLVSSDVTVTHVRGWWTCWHTAAKIFRDKSHAEWSQFARGVWTLDCPEKPGTYMVAAKAAAVESCVPFALYVTHAFRKLSSVEGEVRDTTGFTHADVRTEWRGYWWTEPMPHLQAPQKPSTQLDYTRLTSAGRFDFLGESEAS